MVKVAKYQCLVAFLLMLLTICGCRKWSHNGDLDGYWQVREVVLMDNDSVLPVNNLYISLNLHIVQLSTGGVGNMSYDKRSGRIIWDFPYDGWQSKLKPYGLYAQHEEGSVVEATDKQLILKFPTAKIICRRF